MNTDNLLIVADSERDADMLYAVGMFAPDPFIYLRAGGKCHIVISDLEIDRARRQSAHCRALSLSRYQSALRRNGGRAGFAEVIRMLLREKRLKKIFVSPAFPHGLARELRRMKIKIRVRQGGLFPEREIKSAGEIKKISAALLMAEVGLAEAIQVLKSAKIGRKRQLLHHNVPLTSEKLRAVIDIAVIQAGGMANHTIVAGGRQGSDPHECGHGILRANEPIILDVFPRSQKTGYFGDITRTVVKGRASEEVRALYETVRRAQEAGLDKIAPGVPAAEIHRTVTQVFDSAGYRRSKKNGRQEGFFHGTGHGLGLEIHEAPRLNGVTREILRPGQVFTVEPGLYYSHQGGVRLEDVAVVTRSGGRNLTKFEKTLEV